MVAYQRLISSAHHNHLQSGPHAVASVKALDKAQGGRCYLCGHRFPPRGDRSAGDLLQRTRDHVRPKVKGHGGARNYLLAHQRCNGRKGERSPYPCELIMLEAINLKLGLISG